MTFDKKSLIRFSLYLGTAGLCALAYFGWVTYVTPIILKVPHDFSYAADLVSVDNFFDENENEFSGEKYSNSSFSYKVVSYEKDIAKIQNNFEVKSFGGKKIFAASPVYGIDAKTWKHVEGYGDKDRDGYLFAPRGVKKDQTFRFWYVSTSVGADMSFVGEENLYGLKVYKFEKNSTEPIDQSEFFTHLKGVPEERGIKLVNRLYVWVEPTSGYIVKQEEFSDDYYFFDQKTGKRLGTYNKFSNVYSEKSVISHVNTARTEKYKILAVTHGVPILVLLVGLALFVVNYSQLNHTKRVKILGGIVVIFLIIITSVVSYFIKKNIDDSESALLAQQADEIYLNVDRRVNSYVDILRGAQGLIDSSSFVDRSEWTRYINNLDLEKKYPGVLSIGYAPLVDEADKARFIAAIQEKDIKDFNIFPEETRPKYSPILYIEPQIERNIKVIGFDFYSETNRSNALQQASKIEGLSLTGKIELLNEGVDGDHPGFVMFLPIFRKANRSLDEVYTKENVIGYVFAAFRMEDLMRDLLGSKSIDLCFHIYDGLITSPSALMYDYDPDRIEDVKTLFSRTDVLNIGDRIWAIKFYNDPNFQVEKTKSMLPYVIFFGGIIFSVLFYLVFYFLVTTKERAVAIANELTEELKKSEIDLREKNRIMEEQVDESNKLNQLMVDRELAMIELKKKTK
jgi:CHASE1-domain containing sensor protein